MYRKNRIPKTEMKVNNGYEGESIEKKVRRLLSNNEPLGDGAQLTYTERKDGVSPDYDIRADKWEAAVDAMDRVQQINAEARAERNKDKSIGEQGKEGMEAEGEGKA